MSRKYVDFSQVISASIAAPAVPMTAHSRCIYEGKIIRSTVPIIGILVEVKNHYLRDCRGEFDTGKPTAPPSPESLAREGYEFSFQSTQMSYVVASHDIECPEELEEASNELLTVLPYSEVPSQEWEEEAEKTLKKRK